MIFLRIFSFLFFLCFPLIANALTPVLLETNIKRYPLEKHIDYYEDKKGQYSFKEISSNDFKNNFKKSSDTLNFGYSKSIIWIRLRLINPSPVQQTWLLELKNPLIDKITLFLPSNNQTYSRKISGDSVSFRHRDIKHRFMIYRLNLKGNENMLLYLRLQTSGPFSIPLTIYHPNSFQIKDHNEQTILGFFYGFMAVMVLYNFFIFLMVQDRAYLYYVLYITCVIISLLYFNGSGFEFFWPDNPEWQRYGNIFVTLTFIFTNLFTKNFLNTKENCPRLNRLFPLFLVLWTLLTILIFFIVQSIITPMISALFAPNLIFLLIIAIVCLKQNVRSAYFYLIAWLFLIFGSILNIFLRFGFLPINFFTEYAQQIGIALEVLLLSLGLGDRINTLKQDKYLAQKEMLKAQHTLNVELDSKVKERTLELAEANSTKDKFFSIIAHDLRGPIGNLSVVLNNIIGFNEIIDAELLRVLRRSSKNTYLLLEDLLTWAQNQKGQLDVNPINFTINESIEQATSILNNQASQKNIQFKINLSQEKLNIYADQSMIHTVVRNLISNAIKFTPKNGKITIFTSRFAKMLKVEIHDTGIGLSEEQIVKLFNIGEKNIILPGTIEEKGTGLGLILSKDFIEANQGQIKVESKKDGGSNFWFTIPLATTPSELSISEDFDFMEKLKTLNFLLVDDDPLNQKTSISVLNELNIKHESVYNGLEAIQKAKDFDLILMDLDIPEVNGIEATRRIRENLKSAPPIIALTSYSKTELNKTSSNVQFQGYLHKPLEKKKLLTILYKIQ
ncbi:MAG: response regulator [Desulfobacteraceae bacterium]|nr:response regulator [Desulfobacteraceae bacterium]